MPTNHINRMSNTLVPQRRSLHSRWLLSAFTLFVISFLSIGMARGQGADGGKVDGALWTFEMIPHDKKLEKRSGMFRVDGMNLYQKSDLEKGGFDRKVGQKTVIKAKRNKKGKIVGPERTTLQFTDLQSNAKKHTGMTGKVEITKNKFGEWSGRFIDGNGLHWNFKCSRKQE